MDPLDERQKQLAASYLPLARQIAWEWTRRTGSMRNADRRQLLHDAAVDGLMAAAARWREDSEGLFSSDVVRHIHGDIRDAIKVEIGRRRRADAAQSYLEQDRKATSRPDPLMLDELDHLVSCLPSFHRDCMRLALVGYSQREIASRVGRAQNRVGMRIKESIEFMRQHQSQREASFA